MAKMNNKSLLNNRFEMRSTIGNGGYGVVNLAYDHRLKQIVAIKREAEDSFPVMHDYFRHGGQKYLAMTLLGPSVKSQLSSCNKKMELKTILQIVDQLIDRIKTIHGLCYLHRDIKPENMAMGTGASSNILHLLDFGLAKVFKEDNVHLRGQCRNKIVGTPRYTSLNSHRGIELSRRDDLESMAYSLIYLRKGSLPWQNLPKYDDDTDCYSKVYHEKVRIPPKDLCEGIEPEFAEFLSYARSLSYTEKPNYAKVKQIFCDLYNLKGYNKIEINVNGKNKHATGNLENKKQKRKMNEKKIQETPNKKKKTNTPPKDLPSSIPINVNKDTITSPAPVKEMTRKEKNAALTAIAQEQAK